jgi:thymidylate kinase
MPLSVHSAAARIRVIVSTKRLIALSGIDCAGKSTQLALLEAALRSRGRKVRVFWFRPGYSRELDRLRALVRQVKPGALPRVETLPEKRARAFANSRVRTTWITMAVADTIIQYGLKLRAWLAEGETVVCDRYVHDAILDLTLRFPDQFDASGCVARALVAACPEPSLSLLLMLPKAEMERRMAIKCEPFPDDLPTRELRFAAYGRFASSGAFRVVDAARPIGRIHAEILSSVEALG